MAGIFSLVQAKLSFLRDILMLLFGDLITSHERNQFKIMNFAA
jgi:hypothetical protein